jgi:spermidine/putrescine transport system substrate-binding protein
MNKKGLLRLVLPISLVVVMAVALPLFSGCIGGPAAEAPEAPAAPPPDAEVPEAPAPDAYEEYVAGLPAGCLPVPRETFEQAVEGEKLYLYDWAEWWPEEIFEGFSEEFGIEVIRDHYASMEEVKTKFTLYPEAPYDLVLSLSIEHLYALRELGALQQMNHDWIPNVWEYIPERFIEMEYDPGWKYSVADMVYFTAYLYNTELVDDPRIPSWSVLFEPADEFKGRITLLDEMHEVIGTALKYLGYNFWSVDEAELMEAQELLLEVKPHIMTFDSAPWAIVMRDEAFISHMWYGDGWWYHDEYEAIVPVLPAEGSKLGMGLHLHPMASPNPAAAHLFLNYLFRPEVNALMIEAIYYTPTHTAVPELLSEEALQRLTVPEGFLDKCDPFDPRAVTGRGFELRTEIWEEMKR